MADPLLDRDELTAVMRLVESQAEAYLGEIDDALVRPPRTGGQDGGLPAEGSGSMRAMSELVSASLDEATRSGGPRFFHFVMGGVTPAALGADWLTSTLDQVAYNWVSSPFAARLEQVSLGWLRELFGLLGRHLGLAQRVARQVDNAPDLERLADVPLNVVCFRYRPPGIREAALDDLNRRLGSMILEDGRVYFGTTDYTGKVAFRPAIVNWRTTAEDVDLIVEVVRELGARLVPAESAAPV